MIWITGTITGKGILKRLVLDNNWVCSGIWFTILFTFKNLQVKTGKSCRSVEEFLQGVFQSVLFVLNTYHLTCAAVTFFVFSSPNMYYGNTAASGYVLTELSEGGIGIGREGLARKKSVTHFGHPAPCSTDHTQHWEQPQGVLQIQVQIQIQIQIQPAPCSTDHTQHWEPPQDVLGFRPVFPRWPYYGIFNV